jgi:hypothetical protein
MIAYLKLITGYPLRKNKGLEDYNEGAQGKITLHHQYRYHVSNKDGIVMAVEVRRSNGDVWKKNIDHVREM